MASADELVQKTIIAKSQNKMPSHVCNPRTRNLKKEELITLGKPAHGLGIRAQLLGYNVYCYMIVYA